MSSVRDIHLKIIIWFLFLPASSVQPSIRPWIIATCFLYPSDQHLYIIHWLVLPRMGEHSEGSPESQIGPLPRPSCTSGVCTVRCTSFGLMHEITMLTARLDWWEIQASILRTNGWSSWVRVINACITGNEYQKNDRMLKHIRIRKRWYARSSCALVECVNMYVWWAHWWAQSFKFRTGTTVVTSECFVSYGWRRFSSKLPRRWQLALTGRQQAQLMSW